MSRSNRQGALLSWRSVGLCPVRNRQGGVTLVELIIAMVIISIAAVALLQGLGLQSQRNVDPMIQSQAQRLVIQYLQEVSNKSFFDPSADPRLDPSLTSEAELNLVIDGVNDQTGSSASSNRLAWDNIFEYNDYDGSINDIHGDPVAALSGYAVKIEVDTSPGLVLLPTVMVNSMLTWNTTFNCPPKIAKITVTVTDPRNQETILSAFRTSYFDIRTLALWAGC